MDEDYYWWYINKQIKQQSNLGYYIENCTCDSLLNCAKNWDKH